MVRTAVVGILWMEASWALFAGMTATSYAKDSAAGTTYYVNNLPGADGKNENPGTSEKAPWLDFTPVNSHKFKPGDRILLARGATWNQQLTLNDSGTAERWCELGAYGSGPRPKIIRTGNACDRGVRLNNPSYWKIRDLEVGGAGVGILVYYDTLGHEGLAFEDIFVHDCHGIFTWRMPDDDPVKQQAIKDRIFLASGVLITATKLTLTPSDYVLRNVRFNRIEGTRNGDSVSIDAVNGEFNGPRFVAFRDIVMNHLYLHDDNGPNPGGVPDCLRLTQVSNLVLLNSILDRECGQYTVSGTAAFFLQTVRDLTIVNNMFTRTQNTGSPDQGAIDFEADTKEVNIRNNYFGMNAGPGVEFLDIHGPESCSDDHEVAGNAFEGNGWAAGYAQSGSGGLHHLDWNIAGGVILDNLFYEPGKPMFHGAFIGFLKDNNVAVQQNMYNSMNGFTNAQGTNAWLYQYRTQGIAWKEFEACDTNRQSWISVRSDHQAWIGRFEQCAAGADVARVWKAPFSGKIAIRGRALQSGTGGNAATVQITQNGKTIWVHPSLATNDWNGLETNLDDLDVRRGDLLRFELRDGARDATDAVSWAPTVAYILNSEKGDMGVSNSVVSDIAAKPLDTTPPSIKSFVAMPKTTKAIVVFSEPVEKAGAETRANYAISPGVTVRSATYRTDRVLLTTSPFANGTLYTVTVNGIKDRAKVPNTIATNSMKISQLALAAQWKLDEGKGDTAADSSGNGYDGAIRNGPVWVADAAGSALAFDGKTQFVAGKNGFPGLANDFAMTLWARPAAARTSFPESNEGAPGMIGQRYAIFPSQCGNDAGAGISIGTNGISVFEHGNNYLPAVLVYDQALSGWHHVAVVYEKKQPKLYVNGTLVKTGLTSARNVQPSQNLGGTVTAFGYFEGLLSDVRIYSGALTPEAVRTVMKDGAMKSGAADKAKP